MELQINVSCMYQFLRFESWSKYFTNSFCLPFFIRLNRFYSVSQKDFQKKLLFVHVKFQFSPSILLIMSSIYRFLFYTIFITLDICVKTYLAFLSGKFQLLGVDFVWIVKLNLNWILLVVFLFDLIMDEWFFWRMGLSVRIFFVFLQSFLSTPSDFYQLKL